MSNTKSISQEAVDKLVLRIRRMVFLLFYYSNTPNNVHKSTGE